MDQHSSVEGRAPDHVSPVGRCVHSTQGNLSTDFNTLCVVSRFIQPSGSKVQDIICFFKVLIINIRHSREAQASVPEVLLIRVGNFLFSPKPQQHLLIPSPSHLPCTDLAILELFTEGH
ncbi:uncharacterized protein ACIQIH_005369 isoform 1-T3 [Cyanocitta cristata]